LTPALAKQVECRLLIGCGGPREPKFSRSLSKFFRRLGQPSGVDGKQVIERLDLDVEPFHEGDRHAAQLG
jgi:hypothetical protein